MSDKKRIIVGIDGSPESIWALRWALTNRTLGAGIEAVHSWEYPAYAGALSPIGSVVPSRVTMQDIAIDTLAEAVAELTAPSDIHIEIEQTIAHGPPAGALLTASREADLVVVGSRGGGLMHSLLGSVSRRVLNHANVPTVVVPNNAPLTHKRRVLVGVDGSPNSHAALRWALSLETELIEVAHVWHVPYTYAPYPDIGSVDAMEVAAIELAAHAIDVASGGKGSDRALPIALQGDARTQLRCSGRSPELIVVGSRGHTGLAGALMGSVASSVAAHSDVAVVVVPSVE
jgi:nucleotide-binding universal stress UspA family protein